jgi:hypothetical protein
MIRRPFKFVKDLISNIVFVIIFAVLAIVVGIPLILLMLTLSFMDIIDDD